MIELGFKILSYWRDELAILQYFYFNFFEVMTLCFVMYNDRVSWLSRILLTRIVLRRAYLPPLEEFDYDLEHFGEVQESTIWL